MRQESQRDENAMMSPKNAGIRAVRVAFPTFLRTFALSLYFEMPRLR